MYKKIDIILVLKAMYKYSQEPRRATKFAIIEREMHVMRKSCLLRRPSVRNQKQLAAIAVLPEKLEMPID